MATLVLSAVGASVGSAVGGSMLGVTSTVIGRAVGATLGRAIDARILPAGSEPVETASVDRFRLSGAGDGDAIAQLWGAMRLGGHVIWASRFLETASTTAGGGGGKGGGAPSQPSVTSYSYSVSLALALCEGEIARVGRVWADGAEVPRDALNMRVYTGSETQLPDPKLQAVEGAEFAPAFRGTAYVVIEDLDLGRFGNRVPQFSFEVVRHAQPEEHLPLAERIKAVAIIPGTGEYALATTPVHIAKGPGENSSVNINTAAGKTDLLVSLDQLQEGLPKCASALMVVSWFGDDLRAGRCKIRPKVEDNSTDGQGMPWNVSGLARAQAAEIAKQNDRSVYGGTPADRSVIEGISALKNAGQDVVFYPFLLMEQMAGNGLSDPWTGDEHQPVLPWRGRITLEEAPGRAGSPDGTPAAEAEVAAFFGSVQASDFTIGDGSVTYTGPNEWSLSRFILHAAALCAAAGGVAAFCIGSEMRGLTQIRGAANSFPAVESFRQLAAEVRSLLGPSTKIGYAADWSEYFGYHPQDGSGDVFFHLDPLWADPNIDFVGIDNYMPVSDWRDGIEHLDAAQGGTAPADLGYLKSNIEGGEGFDWYYANEADRIAQNRTAIEDGAYGEDWVYRYKDIRGWWENEHYNRVGGVKVSSPTAWVPGSKPIWFTELGCAAIDKGTNQPNKFLDALSSESDVPHFSSGRRDDLVQARYLEAVLSYWDDAEHNPISPQYGDRMIDLTRAHVWAWDARPWPAFPNAVSVWSDGPNQARGHWLAGRVEAQDLGAVIRELCARVGISDVDVSDVHGLVRGYSLADTGTVRAALQQLVLVHGLDVVERNGALTFSTRREGLATKIEPDHLAIADDNDGLPVRSRSPAAEMAGRVRVTHVDAQDNYQVRVSEAVFPDDDLNAVATNEVSMALIASEGAGIAERWLAEARVSRDGARFALPPSLSDLSVGDCIQIAGDPAKWRLDRSTQDGATIYDAVRVEDNILTPSNSVEKEAAPRSFVPPVPVYPLFLDLPLMTGEEVAHAPHIAVSAKPWPGSVAIYNSVEDAGYEFERFVETAAIVGTTGTALVRAQSGVIDRGAPLRIRLVNGSLSTITDAQLYRGGNLAAIGTGAPGAWELFQFKFADPVEPGVFEVSHRLRGQQGSEVEMPDVWEIGSKFVLINGAVGQLDYPAASRGLLRHYRIGPAQRGYDDPSFVHDVHAFEGRGLRPYKPTHLRALWAGTDLIISWVRRSRIDGDRWDLPDVPIGEASEAYILRILNGETVLREVTTSSSSFTYPQGLRDADALPATYAIEVAQVSDRFGPGPFERIEIDE